MAKSSLWEWFALRLTFAAIMEAMLLASALSLDAFVASFAYGSKKIKVPFKSVQVINLVCSSITGLALFVGAMLKNYITGRVAVTISAVILLLLGIAKLLDSITKSIINKYSGIKREIKFSLCNFKFILNLYANPEAADIDGSKTLSPAEAVSLAVALSLDGVAVGFGAAIGDANGWAVFLASLVTNMIAVLIGGYVGNKLANKTTFNLSWLGGAILILLAFLKLI